MNEILRHYVPQNDIGQEPVIPNPSPELRMTGIAMTGFKH